MKSAQTIRLESFFYNHKLNINEFNAIVGKKNDNDQVGVLFKFIYDELEIRKLNNGKRLYIITNAILFINKLLDNDNKIDKTRLNKNLRKLAKKVFLMENINSGNTKLISNAIDRVLQQEKNKKEDGSDNNNYKLLEYIIEDTKNIKYLEKVFNCIKGSVNSKDKEGKTLFYNIVKKYIELLKTDEVDKESLVYYNNVMLLMKSIKEFTIDKKDLVIYLKIIKENLNKLDLDDKNYNLKKESIKRLKDTITGKQQEEIETINELISKYNINVKFNYDIASELENLKIVENKRDLTRIRDYIISIDGDNTKEIDDGLSARKLSDGTYLLGVHIASPLSYIDYTSPMVKEAINRTSSIYLHNNYKLYSGAKSTSYISMFPTEFATDIVSLKYRKIRSSKSYYFKIDSSGNIIESKIYKGIIKNYKECSYDEANYILSHGTDNERLLNTLTTLQDISELLSQKIKPEQLYIAQKNEDSNPAGLKVGSSLSELIISRTMTLTGSEIANYFSENNYPLLYRVHTISPYDIEKLKNEMKRLSVNSSSKTYGELYSTLLNFYPKARYDTNGSHHGLNLDHYCHITSPIRRASDVVNERALDVCYFNIPNDKDIYELEEFINKSKNIINNKNDRISMFLCEYGSVKEKIKSKVS